MNNQSQVKKERKYFVDWLRIGLIISVFFYHVGMIFRPEMWHVNSAESFPFLEPIMRWLALWRMPLLFLVSGIGTYYALGFRTTKQYVIERIKRLYIPLAVGFFTLVPLMVYVERIDQYGSFWQYLPHMFDGGPYPKGNISWHHLWFIVYLLVISLMISPFIQYSRSEGFNKLRNKLVSICSKKLGLNWLLILLIGSQWLLRPYFPDHTHALFNDWAYFTYYTLYFVIGFVLFTSDDLILALSRQRRLYLIQTILFTVLLFNVRNIFSGELVLDYAYGIVGICMAWSCGMAALGYCREYFNKEHKLRKIMNEAIYPFYLLHQPALIFVGYFVLEWNMSYAMKAVAITLLSLIAIILVYWLIIRPINVLRIAFGMRKLEKSTSKTKVQVGQVLSFDK